MKVKIKKRKILCPDCKTGKESYKVDPTSPVCPYFSCYNGVHCAYYIPDAGKEKDNIFSRIVQKFKNTFSRKP